MNKKLVFNEKIYTYQIDFVGHVNNIVYLQWLENVRVKLLEEVGLPIVDLTEKHQVFPVLSKTSIRYRKPFFLINTVKIEVWISQMNNASFDLDFRFLNENNEVCTTASQTCLFIDRKNMRPIRLQDKYRMYFEQFLAAK